MSIKCLALFFLIAMIAQGASAAEWGNLTGKFVYDGPAPKPAKLKLTKDQEFCGKYETEIVDQSLVIGEAGGLANVFVHVKLAKGKKMDIHADYEKLAEKPVVLDNLHCMFAPHALALWAPKQKLLVKNSDPIGQAVKIDAFNNSSVNAILAVGSEVEQKFQFGEAVAAPVSCGIHPWESAWLLINDTPYFSVTRTDGSFVIRNLPVGEWDFRVWQEKVGNVNAKPTWKKGVFTMKINAGDNDLGTIKLSPDSFNKK